MAISKTLTDITKGAELNKPELSMQYIVAATFGVVVLIFAWRIGGLIFAKGSTLVQSRVPGAATPDFKAALGII